MRIGISISSTHADNGPALMIERARSAHGAGLSSLSIGDHHHMAVPYAQNTPMLGRLLAEWPDRPAGCLFLVPLWHPLIMAEHIGTLAATHGDTFIVQTGIGRGAEQFAALGADLGTRGRNLEAKVDAVKRLLAGETVSAPELHMEQGRVGLLPTGAVEWWIAGGVDVAVQRAARIGDAWYATAGATVETLTPAMATYRDAGGGRAIGRIDALVLDDGDRARAMAGELIDEGYRGMGIDQVIVGSPDDAAEQLEAYADAGFDDMIVRCMTVDQPFALETIAHLGALNQ